MGCATTSIAPHLSPRVHELGVTSGEFHRSRLSSSPDVTVLQGMGVPVIVISAQAHSPDPSPAPPPVPPSSGPQRTEKRDVNLSPTQIRSFEERLRRARPPGGYKPETAIAATSNIVKDRLPATVSFFYCTSLIHHFTMLFAAAIGYRALLQTTLRWRAVPRRGPETAPRGA